MGQRIASYCRVSTADQSCARQERDLREYAARAGHEVVMVFKETASGAKDNRPERRKVLALAQGRKIDAGIFPNLVVNKRIEPKGEEALEQSALTDQRRMVDREIEKRSRGGCGHSRACF